MITVIERVEIRAPSKRVFAHVDDIRNLGWHMTERSSMAMLGSRLSLEILSGQPTGLATYRHSGTIMGLPIRFLRVRHEVHSAVRENLAHDRRATIVDHRVLRDARSRRAAVAVIVAADDLDHL
jgi:hypothetical protein